ncbi:major facilitator superfamily transporter [Apiospora rasikravindrae]|uniref:Major facilitator superfamily transporter n=1 Tax=Apiospora rasikravindrae TaxID=990691 RepID=A0ABR1TA72_9PEZI
MASIGADASLTMAELEKVQTPRKSHHQDISPSSIVTIPGQITESEKDKAEKEAGAPPNGDGPGASSVESSDVEDNGEDETPDGGAKAWLMILGAWCCSFCSYGWVNSVGIFQQYYETGPLSDYTPSQIAWIPSLQIFFLSFLGPVIGRLNDTYGPRVLVAVGSFLHVFGLMMASLSTEYYQILLSQGVCSAVGVSAVFLPALACVSGWFAKRRGLAFGLLSTGSSLGGVVFPLIIANLLRTVGYGWTLRICAFMILALLLVANAFVRARTTSHSAANRARGGGMTRSQMLGPFRERAFQILLLGQFIIPYGLYAPITYLPSAAVGAGMSESLSQYLVTFYNAASLIGRASSGYLSDKAGRFNVFCGACFVASILVLAMWIPGSTDAVIVAFAVLFGLSSGAYISLMAALVSSISPLEELGYRNGLCFLASSIGGLTTSPIAGAILESPVGGWVGLKTFSGVMMFIGTAVTLAVRLQKTGLKLWVAF